MESPILIIPYFLCVWFLSITSYYLEYFFWWLGCIILLNRQRSYEEQLVQFRQAKAQDPSPILSPNVEPYPVDRDEEVDGVDDDDDWRWCVLYDKNFGSVMFGEVSYTSQYNFYLFDTLEKPAIL